MEKNPKKFNYLIASALIYTIAVTFTIQSHETSRIFLYRLLNASFTILIVFFNYRFIIDFLTFLLTLIIEKFKYFFGFKKEVKKEEDKVLKFIEDSLRDKSMINPLVKETASNMPYYPRSQVEKEILRSNAKVDLRTLSNINSKRPTFQTSQKENYSNTSNIQYYLSQNKDFVNKSDTYYKNPHYNLYDKDKTSQIKKIYILKSLIMNNKNFVESLDYSEQSDSIDELANNCLKELKISNHIDKWKNNLKEYLICNFLPGIIFDHEFNINSLNNYLRTSLNINISESFLLSQSNNFSELVDQKFTQFNYYSLSQPQNIVYDINEDNYLSIFYTEDEKIKYLIKKIDEKIKSIKLHQKPITTEKNEGKINKPFYLSSNDFTKITEDINYNNAHLEDHLNNIKKLLFQRIMLNKRFAQGLFKSESQFHSYLIDEYSLIRIKELIQTKLASYKNDKGGEFHGEKWTSVFPTDSILIANIFFNYLDENYKENRLTRQFIVCWPNDPIIEHDTLLLHQSSSSNIEPHFNVIKDNKKIYCYTGRDNFLYATVIYLYLFKDLIQHRKMNIDDFIKNLIIK